ncbi:MAG: NrfD/PsrC family molybdoenzyme membrane anchor subunit [Planctomycetota bacterium]|jgi:formate-dependent nitrite reductase membrane component NrfD
MELKAQSKWRWGVAIYLFLVGLGAGAYVVGVFADFLGAGWEKLAAIGVGLGFPLVAIASAIKITELGKPQNFWRAGMMPGTSWMARGAILLTAFMGVSFVHLIFWIWPFPDALADAEGARHAIGIVGGILAVAVMFYTGILLASNKPIAFWSTAMLPVLFMISALLSGMMGIVIIAMLAGQPFEGAVSKLEYIIAILLVVQAMVLVFYLQGTHRVPESRASAKLVLFGKVAPLFWIGVAGVGLAIPLGLGFFDLFQLYGAKTGGVAVFASVCGLVGSFLIRQVVLAGGIHAPLRAGRFEIPLPIV